MFDEMISWGELITLVLFVLGAALLFYLILVVVNLFKILRKVNRIIEDNEDNLNKSLEKIPEITDNTAKITSIVKDNLEGLDKVMSNVGKISETVKSGAETIQKDIILKAKSVLDIIDAIKKLYDKRKVKAKEKASKKEKEATVYKYKYRHGEDKPEEIIIIQSETEPHEEPNPEEYVRDKAPEVANEADLEVCVDGAVKTNDIIDVPEPEEVGDIDLDLYNETSTNKKEEK